MLKYFFFLHFLGLSLLEPGNAIFIKSLNNIERCWRLMSIDNPDCHKIRGEFNNLKNSCERVWFSLQLSLPCSCFQPRVSFDEGHSWDKYGFTSVPLFVDGALVEAGVETQIMTWVLLCGWEESRGLVSASTEAVGFPQGGLHWSNSVSGPKFPHL